MTINLVFCSVLLPSKVLKQWLLARQSELNKVLQDNYTTNLIKIRNNIVRVSSLTSINCNILFFKDSKDGSSDVIGKAYGVYTYQVSRDTHGLICPGYNFYICKRIGQHINLSIFMNTSVFTKRRVQIKIRS